MGYPKKSTSALYLATVKLPGVKNWHIPPETRPLSPGSADLAVVQAQPSGAARLGLVQPDGA